MGDAAFFDSPTRQLPTFPSKPQRGSKRFLFLVAIVVVVVAWFGKSWFFSDTKTLQAPITVTPTPTEFLLPTDTPSPSKEESFGSTQNKDKEPTAKPTFNPVDKASGLDRNDVMVAVRNGSGVVGAASKASETLKTFGYHVVSIGNAEHFNYLDTVILVKSEKSKYLSLLKSDLASVYAIGSASATLSASSSADAVVIVGKE